MTLGRTSSGAIKIKTDGGTTRAVECACCGGCNLPKVCAGGYQSGGWTDSGYGGCSTNFPALVDQGCLTALFQAIDPFWGYVCPGAKWILIVSGACLGNNQATNPYCKTDGIDSPIGSYYDEFSQNTITITECQI